MNILFYIPDINQGWGGVRQYAVSLLKILSADNTNNYYVFHDCGDPEIIKVLNDHRNLRLLRTSDLKSLKKVQRQNRLKKIGNLLCNVCRKPNKFNYTLNVDLLCRQFKIDIIHCPYQFIPATHHAKLITTLHDVQELHFPGFFSAEARALRANNYLDFIRRATSIVVSYNHVKQDLIDFFNVSSDKIHVILLDMGKLWFEKYRADDMVDISSFAIPTRFLLYPANTWKHKNHIRLLEAIALLRDKHGLIVNLVCSGDKNEFFHEKIQRSITDLQLEGQVRFLGVVDEKSLFTLYKSTIGVVVPTLYEAGSFPLMESILLNIPVICSNVTSLPETIQNEDFVFNPMNVTDIADKVKKLWTEEGYRLKSIQNSTKVAPSLKDQSAVSKFVRVYNEAMMTSVHY